MRRYARTLVLIGVLVLLAGLALGFQTIRIGSFQRGGDTLLGLSLGLDLQGGIDLRYQALDPVTGEFDKSPDPEDMKKLKRSIERRVNTSGLGQPDIQILGNDRLLIQLPGVQDTARAKSLIGETARLEIKHRMLNVARDLPGVSSDNILTVAVRPINESQSGEPAATTQPTPASQADATSTEATLEEEPNEEPAYFVLEIEFTESAAEEFAKVVEQLRESLEPLPGTTELDPETGEVVPGTGRTYPSHLELSVRGSTSAPLQIAYAPFMVLSDGQVFPLPDEPYIQRVGDSTTFTINLEGVFADIAEAQSLFREDSEVKIVEVLGKLDEDIGLTGDDLARAYAGQHRTTGQPIINLEFTSEGTRKFAEVTKKIAGTPDTTAFILDGIELIAPGADEPILSGTAYIYGPNFTFERVRDVALLLESGRLPIPIELVREQDVDAILGADSLAKSVVAGIVGLSLVLLFMVMYYRVPGVVAAIALMIYAAIVLAIFKILPVTMTLAGVAAAVLSIGMAVDANILIFERMKEELRAGRTLLSAVNIGFNRAWTAIRDSNVSTLITCAILFWFADALDATVVQSFAATLAIGVAISMFSAITVSRTFLRLLAETALGKRLGLFVPSGGADLPQQVRRAETV